MSESPEKLPVSEVVRRNLMHVVGAVVGGLALGFMRIPVVVVWTVVVAIALKEIFVDPHPTGWYWVKSGIDLSVWTAGIFGARHLARRVK